MMQKASLLLSICTERGQKKAALLYGQGGFSCNAYRTRLLTTLWYNFLFRMVGGNVCVAVDVFLHCLHRCILCGRSVAADECIDRCSPGKHRTNSEVLGEVRLGVHPLGALGGGALCCPTQEVWNFVPLQRHPPPTLPSGGKE